jgi:uncharacterized protein involved in exopolysaccharide biosynthesis
VQDSGLERGSAVDAGAGNLARYLAAAAGRKGLVFSLFFVAAAASFLGTVIQAPVYTATGRILIKKQQPALAAAARIAALSGVSPGTETELQILKARTTLEEAIGKLHLDVDVRRDARDSAWWRLRDVAARYLKIFPAPDRRLSSTALELEEFSLPEALRPAKFRVVPGEGGVFEVFDLTGVLGAKGASLGAGKVGEPFENGQLRMVVSRMEDYGATTFTLTAKPAFDTFEALAGAVEAKESGFQSGVIKLEVEDKSASRAADIANELLKIYERRSVDFTRQGATQTLDFVNGQLEEVEKALEESRRKLDGFKSSKGTVLLSEEAKGLITQMSALESQAETARLELDQTRKLKRRLVSGSTEDYVLSGTGSYTPLGFVGIDLFQRLVSLQLERSNLLQVMTPEHNNVKAVDARIKELKGIIISNIDNHIKALEGEISDYDKLVAGYKAQMKNLPGMESELTVLSTELEVNYKLYRQLREQKQQAELTAASQVSGIFILDPAVPPAKHTRPKRLTTSVIGGLFGLFIGLVWAALLGPPARKERRAAAEGSK